MKDQRMLRVVSPSFVAGAVWQRTQDEGWQCVEAAPIIGWMKGNGAKVVHAYLKRKGWRYEWVKDQALPHESTNEHERKES